MLNPKKISNLIAAKYYNMSLRAQSGNLLMQINDAKLVICPKEIASSFLLAMTQCLVNILQPNA